MSTNAPASSSQGNASTPRSPVERVIVWGGIGLLLAAVLVEFTARTRYTSAVDGVMQRVKEADEADKPLKKADINQLVGGREPVSSEDVSGKNLHNAPKKVEKYTWWSLNPNANRVLLVYYGHGDDPDVLSAATKEEETAEEKFKAPVATGAGSDAGGQPTESAAGEAAGGTPETRPATEETKSEEPKKEEETKKEGEPKSEGDAKPKADEKTE